MKILHVTPFYEPAWRMGGVVRAVTQLCRGLRSVGAEISVYTTNGNGTGWLDVPVDRPIDVDGVTVNYFHTPMPRVFRYSAALAKACRRNIRDFDLVHVASFWNHPGIAACREARSQHVATIISPHGTLAPSPLRHHSLRKWLYMAIVERRNLDNAAAIHFATDMEREGAAALGLAPPSFVVPNGLSFNESCDPQGGLEFRSRYGIDRGDLLITHIGRLERAKGVDILLEAFGKVATRVQRSHLLLGGPDAGLQSWLEGRIESLRLEGRVTFSGFLDATARSQALSTTDVFALVSLSENFGYSAVEAMALGVPVIVSDRVGIAPDVKEDATGVVVPLDVKVIAEAIERVAVDRRLLGEMSRAAYSSSRRRYGAGHVASLMLQAYRDTLSGSRSGSCRWTEMR